MDFTLTPEQLSLQQAVRKFAQRELPEIAQQIESNDEPADHALRQRFGELGYRMVIHPLSMMRLAMGEVARGLAVLRETGSVDSLLDRM